jgi:hypothetical protein
MLAEALLSVGPLFDGLFVREQLMRVATTMYASSLSGSGSLSGSIFPIHLDPDPDPDSDHEYV